VRNEKRATALIRPDTEEVADAPSQLRAFAMRRGETVSSALTEYLQIAQPNF
jgi:hypothetical protein